MIKWVSLEKQNKGCLGQRTEDLKGQWEEESLKFLNGQSFEKSEADVYSFCREHGPIWIPIGGIYST